MAHKERYDPRIALITNDQECLKRGIKWQVDFFFFFHVLERILLVDLKLDNCCKLLRRKQALLFPRNIKITTELSPRILKGYLRFSNSVFIKRVQLENPFL